MRPLQMRSTAAWRGILPVVLLEGLGRYAPQRQRVVQVRILRRLSYKRIRPVAVNKRSWRYDNRNKRGI